MAVSKVVYDGNTLIDLTGDNVTADKLLVGYKTHGADGELVEGTCTYDSDTQDATASEAEILIGKSAYVRGSKKTGTMKNNGAVSGTISEKDGVYSIPQGYHDGSGVVKISDVEKSKLIPDNIRDGIEILGIVGTMSGTEDAKPQAKTVTPSSSAQVILPDDGYNYLSQVTVEKIPYVENDNSAGGTTVTIG